MNIDGCVPPKCAFQTLGCELFPTHLIPLLPSRKRPPSREKTQSFMGSSEHRKRFPRCFPRFAHDPAMICFATSACGDGAVVAMSTA